jgi:hypothetical protein
MGIGINAPAAFLLALLALLAGIGLGLAGHRTNVVTAPDEQAPADSTLLELVAPKVAALGFLLLANILHWLSKCGLNRVSE